MRITAILWVNLISFFAISLPLCNAEKIYYKNGSPLSGKITSRDINYVWLDINVGKNIKNIPVNIKDIDRIEDEDGSISKYDYSSLFNKSQEDIEHKRYSHAVQLYSKLLESFPDNKQIHYLRGILNHKIGNLEDALIDYKFLIEHNVADAQIFNNIGAIYAENNNYQEALDLLESAVRANPNIAEAHNNLAELSLKTKNYDLAIQEYNKSVSLKPDNTQALYRLGIAYMAKGDYLKAREELENYLSRMPNDSNAKKSLEYVKAKMDKAKE